MAPNYEAQESEPGAPDLREERQPGAPEEPTGEQPKEGQPPAAPAPTFSFGEPPPAPSGQEWDPVALKDFDGAVQDLGAGPEDAKWVLGRYAGWTAPKDEASYNAAMASAETALRKEWGPLYEEKMEAAIAVAKGLPPTLLRELDESGMGNDPELIKRFVAIAERMGSARDQINAILGNRSHPYNDRMHPEHEKAVRDLQKLYEKVHGSRPLS